MERDVSIDATPDDLAEAVLRPVRGWSKTKILKPPSLWT